MFTKIKEFLFGKPLTSEVPYKIETPAPTMVEVVPAGTEASVAAAPNPKTRPAKKPAAPKVPVKPAAPAKPKTTKSTAK